MIVSKKNNFIFFSAGKTGTTSIESILKEYEDYNVQLTPEEIRIFNKHIPPYYGRAKVQIDMWNNLFKFAFVRNPWDWTISRWKFNINKWGLPNTEKITEEVIDQIQKINSPNFRGIFWTDTVMQKKRLSNPDGVILVDKVYKFEKIDESWREICEKINIPYHKLPKLNKTKRKDYRCYYTDSTKEIIREIYKEDIEEFNYQF